MPLTQAAGCPSHVRIGAVIVRFTANLKVLETFAVPNDPSIFGHLGEWAIPGPLANAIDGDWRSIQSWWNACLTQDERTRVNRAVQDFKGGLGGLLGSGLGSGLASSLGDWQHLLIRVAAGAAGLLLVLVGVVIIAGDVTLSQAAAKFGKAIGGR